MRSPSGYRSGIRSRARSNIHQLRLKTEKKDQYRETKRLVLKANFIYVRLNPSHLTSTLDVRSKMTPENEDTVCIKQAL